MAGAGRAPATGPGAGSLTDQDRGDLATLAAPARRAGASPETAPRLRGRFRGAATAPIEFLRPSRVQPRREFVASEIESLAESIRERGILQPILVRPDPDNSGRYEIVAGELVQIVDLRGC